MKWKVALKESVIDDLKHFGKKQHRAILKQVIAILEKKPLEESRNLKVLRPNAMAERELRLFGKYRVLFNVSQPEQTVTVLVVGEKKGNALYVRGKEFRAHHEDHPAE